MKKLPGMISGIVVLLFFYGCVFNERQEVGRGSVPGDKIEYREAGDFNRTLEYDGLERTYVLHVPPESDAGEPVPLVVVLHGATGNADTMINCTYVKMNEKADSRGYIVVYPEGTGDAAERVYFWNAAHCCGPPWENDIDDVGFIRFLIETLVPELNIDPTRIFVTGFSNGAMMAHRIAAEMSNVAAAAPVAGTVGGRNSPDEDAAIISSPLEPVPILMIHGELDLEIPYYGGHIVAMYGRIDMPVNASVSFWVLHNNCFPEPETEFSPTGDYIKETYHPIDDVSGAEVILYTMPNVGHDWPEIMGDSPATDIILDFFSRHGKKLKKGPGN